MSDTPRVRFKRIHIENYRSIGNVTLRLDDVTVLVGNNGAGKSNLVDALQFLADAVRDGLSVAVGRRGGIKAIQRRTPSGRPPDLRLEVEFDAPRRGTPGSQDTMGYGVCLEPVKPSGWRVKDEWVSRQGVIWVDRGAKLPSDFLEFTGADELPDDRLIFPALLKVLHWVEQMATFSIAPQSIRPPQEFNDEPLRRDGSNLYHVWGRLERNWPERAQRVLRLFQQIVPQVQSLQFRELGKFGTIEVNFDCGDDGTIAIDGSGLSDGSLRALGILVAVFDPEDFPLVALEEPEVSMHPYAAGRLLDAVLSARHGRQILMTTQSPHLLNESAVKVDMLRVVGWRDGVTVVGDVAEGQVQEIRERLVTEAELMAEGALDMAPPPKTPRRLKPRTK